MSFSYTGKQAYEVSTATVYKWVALYSGKQKPDRTIVESKSDTAEILALQKRIAALERALGKKTIQLVFKDKMIELAEQTYKVDIKKNSRPNQPFILNPPSSTLFVTLSNYSDP